MKEKRILILAGPNGAGKTTFAREFLPKEMDCPLFVNADLIAQGLSPFAPELAEVQAGRIMLQRMKELVRAGESFGFETTLSPVTYAERIPEWRQSGYQIDLLFLELDSEELALDRVKQRVLQGGHDVASDVLRRRFSRGQENFKTIYRPKVDRWMLFNTSTELPIMKSKGGRAKRPDDEALLQGAKAALLRASQNASLIALQTGTRLVLMRDGKVLELGPDDLITSQNRVGPHEEHRVERC